MRVDVVAFGISDGVGMGAEDGAGEGGKSWGGRGSRWKDSGWRRWAADRSIVAGRVYIRVRIRTRIMLWRQWTTAQLRIIDSAQSNVGGHRGQRTRLRMYESASIPLARGTIQQSRVCVVNLHRMMVQAKRWGHLEQRAAHIS
jgi:hypothetical protein